VTLYFITSLDGKRVMTDLDTGKYIAYETEAMAQAMIDAIGEDYGPLRVEPREAIDDQEPDAKEGA